MAISLKQKKLPVHALKHSRYVFSTAKVCSDKQKRGFATARARKVPACVRACLRLCTLWNCYRFFFSTGKVFSDKGKTRSVEKIEFQCQGALERPVHTRCMRACMLWNCYRFFFSTDIVCYDIGWLYQLKKLNSNVRGLCKGPSTQG